MSGSSPNSFLYDLVNLTEIPTETIVVQSPSDNEFVFDFHTDEVDGQRELVGVGFEGQSRNFNILNMMFEQHFVQESIGVSSVHDILHYENPLILNIFSEANDILYCSRGFGAIIRTYADATHTARNRQMFE